jgi:hypothetical protein
MLKQRWVIQWALSVNSQETEIIFYCTESESVHNRMLLSSEEKLLFEKDTEYWTQNLFVQNLFSIHMTQQWLNTQKKCNWCSFIITILLIRNVAECLYILLNCDKCCINNSWKDCWQSFLKPLPVSENLTKDIHWLCDRSAVKWRLYESTDDYRLSQQKVILKLCKEMTAEWVTQTFVQQFLLSSWAFMQ